MRSPSGSDPRRKRSKSASPEPSNTSVTKRATSTTPDNCRFPGVPGNPPDPSDIPRPQLRRLPAECGEAAGWRYGTRSPGCSGCESGRACSAARKLTSACSFAARGPLRLGITFQVEPRGLEPLMPWAG
ncbi:hypothetical protein E1166_27405 [Micromonospora sp. KC213]|nr:hypothetical protein E1166_27405 [Micromonospora sp. KC213]